MITTIVERENSLRRGPAALAVAFAVCIGGMQPAAVLPQVETYERATVDGSGQLRILTTDDREILLSKAGDQLGVAKPALSPTRTAVGWLALYPNWRTSSPVPLKLVIYSRGHFDTFTGIGLPMSRWRFEDDGRQVAFKQETVHGDLGVHYELRDISTGRLVADFEPGGGGAAPPWVQRLDAEP